MLSGGAVMCTPHVAQASASLPDSCDASLHDLISTRAWMEAQREIEAAQTLVTRPENHAAFSCLSLHLDAAKDLTTYSNDLQGNVKGLTDAVVQACLNMRDAMKTMRCQDADKATLFLSFDGLRDQDGRPGCKANQSEVSDKRTKDWKSAYSQTFLHDTRAVDAGGADPLLTFAAKKEPDGCAQSAVTLTGTQHRNNGTLKPRQEGICLAPGCYFDGTQCTAFE